MSLRHRIAIAVIGIVLILQFGVPALQLFSEGSNRWGWQMYSRGQSLPRIVAVEVDGRRAPVDYRRYLVLSRSELRFDDDALEQLCDRLTGVASLEVINRTTGETTEYRCGNV